MYESYYGFRERPFSLTPDPAFLYPSREHRRALSLMEYGVRDAGFTVLTGEVGSGKTTLLRALLQRIDTDVVAGLITNTHQDFGDLLDWVLLAFGQPYGHETRAARYDEFMHFLVKQYGAGRRALLIVDEAQNLEPQALEELRVLSNVNSHKHEVLQLLLVGQPELRDTLRRHDMRQIAQRIVADYHLQSLSAEETQLYVRHRIQVAGGRSSVFDSAAVDAAHDASGGVPRLINRLCDTALVYGFADQVECVSADLMRQVILDRREGGVLPLTDNALRSQSPPALGDPPALQRDMS